MCGVSEDISLYRIGGNMLYNMFVTLIFYYAVFVLFWLIHLCNTNVPELNTIMLLMKYK